MSARISNERLNELFEEAESDSDEESAFGEIMDHRRRETALLLELRALAERMGKKQYGIPSLMNEYASGQQNAVDYWSSELTSLLAAHDAQQAEGKGE